MKSELAWLDMIDRLEDPAKASKPMAIASLAVASIGKVTSIRTFERGVLVNKLDISPNVIG